jgi:hypothetical protein
MTAKSYAAFISSSHAVDGALAPAIKAALVLTDGEIACSYCPQEWLA